MRKNGDLVEIFRLIVMSDKPDEYSSLSMTPELQLLHIRGRHLSTVAPETVLFSDQSYMYLEGKISSSVIIGSRFKFVTQ